MSRAHWLVFASATSLFACSAGGESSPGVVFGDPDTGIDPQSDTSSGFDVSVDVNVGDTLDGSACAKSEAAAVKPPVDIIVSVDQSGSMGDDIANVKANINKLSDFLKLTGLDYRVVMIGTVGTSTFAICVPPPLGGAACASNPPNFRTVNQNIQSTDTLTKILSTYDSKAAGIIWSDFIRPGAIKAFVPITDDDSRTYPYTTFDTELLKRGAGTFGTAAARRYIFYPICGASAADATKVCGSNAVNVGKQYTELAKLTKGKWFPICLKDFGPVFSEIAKGIADSVACELLIPPPPAGETFDPAKINVTSKCSGKTETILKDDSKPCDAGANGWQYSADKTKVLLCGTACAAVRADATCKVTVEFGCETKAKPPA